MKDNLSLQNLKKRYNAPMPSFWKKVTKAMLTIGGVGLAIVGAAATVFIPPLIVTVAGYMIAVGSVGTVLTQFTTTAPQPPESYS